MKFTIKPIDTLFFKDGKPFSMGEETWADGLTVPYPSVLHGALKTAYYSENLEDFDKVVTERNDVAFDKIKITDVFYIIESQPAAFYPAPLDLVYKKNKSNFVKQKEKGTKVYELFKLNNFKKVLSKAGQLLVAISDEEVEYFDGCLINSIFLENYLLEEDENFKCKNIKDYFISEPKVGIARNNVTLTTEEGKLYRVDMKRAQKFEFGVEINNELSIANYAKFGGEGKIINLIKKDKISQVEPKFNFNEINTKKFKLYLSTPAIFENGWLPKWINPETFIGELNGNKIKLASTFIGKPIMIGGFDMTKNMPKVMRRAVPQGSVYYFELLDGNLEDIFNTINKTSISEMDTAQQGFGITYFGVWK